jgi:formamidopyrimidine-DNA glycosylase
VPELPEVETIVRSIAPRLAGRTITHARFPASLVLRGKPAPDVVGRKILSVRRLGKFILMETDAGMLRIHLGMTGKLLLDAAPGPYTRAELTLDRGNLLYDDIRMFGRVEWNPSEPRLGPDPLSLTEDEFAALLASRRGRIKPLLLNQAFVRGMGNIYTDEALFRAGIHPRRRAEKISPARRRALFRAMLDVLRSAIENRGSSVSDYVDGDGRRGEFQQLHCVYGKEGEPCLTCGKPIRRIVVAQRGTHYCPRCQR